MEEGSKEGQLPYSPQIKYRMGQTTAEKPKQSFLAKARNVLLAGLGIAGAGAAAEATVHPVENTVKTVTQEIESIKEAGEQIVDVNRGAYDKFLVRQEDGTLVVSQNPQIVEVKFTPHTDPTSQLWNENNIVIHRKPQADFGEGQDFPADQISATHAIRVTGGAFGGQTDIGRFEVDINGTKYTVGEWFKLSDAQGNLTDPKGQPLQEGESPYFIAGSFATVLNSSGSSQEIPSQ